ncbi:MAG: hydroxysqualene dehydroxylase HpnE [Armatimonadota bacterium]|nr:hydroxysqualene dehydroxylase HpnE [bacterium]
MGGGVAGLACACELADAGLDVRVFEAKNRLGGRAHSFRERETGATIDNCQHVLLGCCDAARGFLDKIGSAERIAFYDQMTLIGAKGESLTIKSSMLPAPLHLLPAILRTRYFTAGEKLELGRVFARIAQTPPENTLSARDYLREIKCPQRLIDLLIDPILASALNETASDASAEYARMVVSKSLMEGRHGYKLGVPDGPLSQLIEVPALRYLSRRGCMVHTSAKIEKLHFRGDMVTSALLSDGKRIRPDYYVCAVPPWSLDEMGFATYAARRLRWRPIVCVHLFYDDPCVDFERSCVVGEPFGWVFNKTSDFGLNFGYIQAVASAAESLNGLDNNDIIELAERAVAKAIPHPHKPALKRAVIYNASRATFSTGDTSDGLRPSTVTPIQNLFLAGDWTDTRWPATIEGAAISGIKAANAILRR